LNLVSCIGSTGWNYGDGRCGAVVAPAAGAPSRPRAAPRGGLGPDVAVLAFPLCSGAALSSISRFVAGAWSGFVILADWLSTAGRRRRALVYAGLAVASVFLLRYWADGVFIG
jgi:hypothetical protein